MTIQSSLSGQSRVNILSSGTSTVALVPGQVVQGWPRPSSTRSWSRLGLALVEASHLSHTDLRGPTDGRRGRSPGPANPRVAPGNRQRGTRVGRGDSTRPRIERAGNVEELVKRITAAGPKIESALSHLESITTQADGLITDNRPNIRETVTSLRDLMATIQDITTKDRVKIEKLLDGLDGTKSSGPTGCSTRPT